jgi:hypothetical protein
MCSGTKSFGHVFLNRVSKIYLFQKPDIRDVVLIYQVKIILHIVEELKQLRIR